MNIEEAKTIITQMIGPIEDIDQIAADLVKMSKDLGAFQNPPREYAINHLQKHMIDFYTEYTVKLDEELEKNLKQFSEARNKFGETSDGA